MTKKGEMLLLNSGGKLEWVFNHYKKEDMKLFPQFLQINGWVFDLPNEEMMFCIATGESKKFDDILKLWEDSRYG